MEEDTNWETKPMSLPDLVLLGISGGHQILVMVAVVHLIICREWPPYVTKNATLVAATGVGGTLSLVVGILCKGGIVHKPGDNPGWCNMEAILVALGSSMNSFPAFVRVYRNYKLLILHSAQMWPGLGQLLAVILPSLIPGLVMWFVPGLTEFDPRLRHCFTNLWIDITVTIYVWGGLVAAMWMVVRMRRVRKQL
ncbi:unnamed protein product, partial [Discosporangium mesarthrocarpum]